MSKLLNIIVRNYKPRLNLYNLGYYSYYIIITFIIKVKQAVFILLKNSYLSPLVITTTLISDVYLKETFFKVSKYFLYKQAY